MNLAHITRLDLHIPPWPSACGSVMLAHTYVGICNIIHSCTVHDTWVFSLADVFGCIMIFIFTNNTPLQDSVG